MKVLQTNRPYVAKDKIIKYPRSFFGSFQGGMVKLLCGDVPLKRVVDEIKKSLQEYYYFN